MQSILSDGGLFRHASRTGNKARSLPSELGLGAVEGSGAASGTGVADAGALGAGTGAAVVGTDASEGAGTGASVPAAASQQNGGRRRMGLRRSSANISQLSLTRVTLVETPAGMHDPMKILPS